jgi:hypothetical protein
MVHSLKHTVINGGNHQTGIGFALGETIHFGSLEFITDLFSNLSLSPEGNDSGSVFMGMVHNKSSSLHTIFEESTNEDDTTSSGRGDSGFPSLEGATW